MYCEVPCDGLIHRVREMSEIPNFRLILSRHRLDGLFLQGKKKKKKKYENMEK
jgi:hypothetical protein